MLLMSSVLGLIPARGGSKRLPRKNLRPLCGKPLIAWTIEVAKASKLIDRVVVSSEDPEILAVGQRLGADVPFVRPKSLAADHTPGVAPVLHAARTLPIYDVIVVLQPTSPLRSVEDVDACTALIIDKEAAAAVSLQPVEKPLQWVYEVDGAGLMRPFVGKEEVSARQQAPNLYVLNGAVYVIRRRVLMETESLVPKGSRGYIMPPERSIDIDSEMDLAFAALLIEDQHCNGSVDST